MVFYLLNTPKTTFPPPTVSNGPGYTAASSATFLMGAGKITGLAVALTDLKSGKFGWKKMVNVLGW